MIKPKNQRDAPNSIKPGNTHMDNQIVAAAMPQFKVADIKSELRASTGLKGKALEAAVFSEMRRRNSAVIGMFAEMQAQGWACEKFVQTKTGKVNASWRPPSPEEAARRQAERDLKAAQERAAAAEAELAALRASLPESTEE